MLSTTVLYLPFSIAYTVLQYTQLRNHRPNMRNKDFIFCSFIFCWIRNNNTGSRSRQKFRIQADPEPKNCTWRRRLKASPNPCEAGRRRPLGAAAGERSSTFLRLSSTCLPTLGKKVLHARVAASGPPFIIIIIPVYIIIIYYS